MTTYREPTNLPTITYPLAVDKEIQLLQTELKARLSWLEYSFGRAFLGQDEQRAGDYVYPMVHKGNKEYKDASPNDYLKSQSFFFIDGDYDYDNYEINTANKIEVPVSLIIWGNLSKISSTPEHFGQVLLQDVLRVLREWGSVKVNRITDNEPDVFSPFSVRDEHTHLFYYPYFCYRIEMTMYTSEECGEDIDQALTDYNIT